MYWNKPTHLFNRATHESSCIAAETVRFRNLWLANSDCIITHVCTYSHRLLPATSPQGACYLVGKSFQLSLYCVHLMWRLTKPQINLCLLFFWHKLPLSKTYISCKTNLILSSEMPWEPLIRCIHNDCTFENRFLQNGATLSRCC